MKTAFNSFMKFIAGIASESDGTPSSKRVSALWVVFALVTAIIGILLYIVAQASAGKIKLTMEALTVIQFIGGTVLITLLTFAMGLFGINGWQGIMAMKQDKLTEKILPKEEPAPEANNDQQSTINEPSNDQQ